MHSPTTLPDGFSESGVAEAIRTDDPPFQRQGSGDDVISSIDPEPVADRGRDGDASVAGVDSLGEDFGIRVTGLAAGHEVRCLRRNLGSVAIGEVLLPGAVRLDVEPSDIVVVIRRVSGTLDCPIDDEDSGGWFLAAENVPCVLIAEGAHLAIVTVNDAVIRRVAAEHAATLPHRIRFLDARVRSRQKARVLDAAIEFVRSVAKDEASADTVVNNAAVRGFAAAVMSSFPNNVVTPDQYRGRGNQPPALRQAMSYIVAHAKADIGINEIADAVHLTPRAVQYMFRRHLGTTPTEYLRHVRMEGAHRDLVTGDRATTSVGDIAQRWGFAHTGRFAVMYRENYDQSPHTTLRG